MSPLVLDAGAFIALERRDTRMLAVADELHRARQVGYTPAGVVAAVWRGSARQHAVGRLLRAGAVQIEPLSAELAYGIGRRLGRTSTSDVIDAHVAVLARRLRATVLTADPDDLAALDPTLTLVVV